jgi:hypothetical protein
MLFAALALFAAAIVAALLGFAGPVGGLGTLLPVVGVVAAAQLFARRRGGPPR